MKPTLLQLSIGILLLATQLATAQSRFVTLTIGHDNPTNYLAIGTNEAARIVSFLGTFSTSRVMVAKDGFTADVGDPINVPKGLTIAGPAKMTLYSLAVPAGDGLLTLEIIPESFPPDKTILIPAGTGGANIALESSTDLIHWTNAAPGPYTNLNTHLFFRIRADRIP